MSSDKINGGSHLSVIYICNKIINVKFHVQFWEIMLSIIATLCLMCFYSVAVIV